MKELRNAYALMTMTIGGTDKEANRFAGHLEDFATAKFSEKLRDLVPNCAHLTNSITPRRLTEAITNYFASHFYKERAGKLLHEEEPVIKELT